ncbi:MAG: hypothetical protein KAT25_01990 [Sulfuriflexus sp.]|nr:hypothetical protein [Sulfuriflexus sp.]
MSRLLSLQKGTTLVELIITIVVLGIGLSSILVVMSRNAGSSADPLILHQGIAIAEAYIEEIVEKPFSDPDGVDGEATRDLYDDIDDYAAIVAQVPRDQNGNVIAGLNGYLVTVKIIATEALGPVGNPAPALNTRRITVEVTTPTSGGTPLTMSAYRTDFF